MIGASERNDAKKSTLGGSSGAAPEMPEHPDIQTIEWYHYLPGYGFITDFLINPPTPTSIERTLQILILIVALMMSALGGVALSGTFEEVQSAMKRGGLTNDTSWSFCHGLDLATIDVTLGKDAANYCTRVLQPKTGCTEANGQFSGVTNGYFLAASYGSDCYGWAQQTLIYGTSQSLTESTTALSIALFAFVFLYLGMVTTSFKTSTGKYSQDMMLSWWRFCVTPLLVAVVFMCWGIVRFFTFMWGMMLVKFPNLVNEVSSGTGGANDNAGNAFYNFSRQFGVWNAYVMPVISISVVILVGYGSSFKARTYVRAKEALRNKVAELYKNDPQLHALLVAAELDRNSVSMIVDADIEYASLFGVREKEVVLVFMLRELGLPVTDQLKLIDKLQSAPEPVKKTISKDLGTLCRHKAKAITSSDEDLSEAEAAPNENSHEEYLKTDLKTIKPKAQNPPAAQDAVAIDVDPTPESTSTTVVNPAADTTTVSPDVPESI